MPYICLHWFYHNLLKKVLLFTILMVEIILELYKLRKSEMVASVLYLWAEMYVSTINLLCFVQVFNVASNLNVRALEAHTLCEK